LVDRVLVEGWSLTAAAAAAGVSERTAWKWVDRYRREGAAGLEERPSAPRRVRSRTPAEREEVILSLRELRFTSPEIAETLGMPLSTVGGVLARSGLGRLPRLQPDEPVNSYERPRPGELVHIDVKKLGRIGRPGHRVNGDRTTRMRGVGWELATSPSTTRPGSPTSRCSTTRKARPRPASSAARFASSAATESASSAS
jgi:hypothetical protein